MVLQLWDDGLLLADGEGTPKPVADHADCCCGGDCEFCTGNNPAQLQVTFANYGNALCDNCDAYLNSTFILDILEEVSCSYIFGAVNVLDCPPGVRNVAVFLYYEAGPNPGDAKIRVVLTTGNPALGHLYVTYEKIYTDPDKPDCDPAGAVNIPYVSHSDGDGLCSNHAASTCLLSTVP